MVCRTGMVRGMGARLVRLNALFSTKGLREKLFIAALFLILIEIVIPTDSRIISQAELEYEGNYYILSVVAQENEERGSHWEIWLKNRRPASQKIWESEREYHPWKIEAGDIDGDTEPEIGLGVWKRTRYHPVYANRLFIYSWNHGKPIPKWFGSNLLHQLIDFTFHDIDADGINELISLELAEDGIKSVMWYKWCQFGFEGWYLLRDVDWLSLSQEELEKLTPSNLSEYARLWIRGDSKKSGLQKLILAYPEQLKSARGNSLIWQDNSEMIYDDGIQNKDFIALLNSPDLEDQLSMPYPSCRDYLIPPPLNFDPGRIRYEPFFMKMYGRSPKEVEKKLVPIYWLPKSLNKRLLVTEVNDVHKKLQAISNELETLPSPIKKYIDNPAGTYNWRKIADTNRLSPHCFGIAIDIDIEYADYWKWDIVDSSGNLSYRNRIPIEIVEIFEKYGFIWGGSGTIMIRCTLSTDLSYWKTNIFTCPMRTSAMLRSRLSYQSS